MTQQERDAKDLQLQALFAGYLSSNPTDATYETYLDALDGISVEAVRRAVAEFTDGSLKRDHRFAPNSSEFAARARLLGEAIEVATRQLQKAFEPVPERPAIVRYPMGAEPPDGYKPLGPVRVNFGQGGDIDMSNMSHAEKESVMQNKGLPAPSSSKAVAAPKLKRI